MLKPARLKLRSYNMSGLYNVILFSFLNLPFLHAQNNQPKEKEILAINAGIGFCTFYGDVGSNSLVRPYNFIRGGYFFSVEKNMLKNFSASVTVMYGKIASDEKTSDNFSKLNFESSITQLGITGSFFAPVKEGQNIVPFASTGIALILFNPHGDLLDKHGNSYYYWADGSIHDLPDNATNLFHSRIIARDYKYETKLGDSAGYSRSALSVPLRAGVKLKLYSHCDVNLDLTYNILFTDYLDNVKASGNDAYLFSSASLTWHIYTNRKKAKEKEKYSKIDFAAIDKSDTDQDGVPDINDLCPNNPVGVKVGANGCPIDADGDGIPDYLDKQPHSKHGAIVDANGNETTKAKMTELQKKIATQTASPRAALNDKFNLKPSDEYLKAVDEAVSKKTNSSSIPDDIKIADENNDGVISSVEIKKIINAFFDGSVDLTAEKIQKIIDFFFEQ